jgi:hypothetical protein
MTESFMARAIWSRISSPNQAVSCHRHPLREDGAELPGCRPAHGGRGERASAADGRAEEGSFAVAAYAGRLYIFVEEMFELVVRGHLVTLATFLMQANPLALAVGKIVLDPHGDDCADAGEGVGHDTDQRAVAQADLGGGIRR